MHSSGSDHKDTEDTLIMPQIMPMDQSEHATSGEPGQGRDSKPLRTFRIKDPVGPLPRIMTSSPVPLHARLSRIQRESKKGIRVLDMDNQGASHHYDYEDVTDSSQDFSSSRRHSVAEEDVCFPPQSADLDIDYEALEEYIKQEHIKMEKLRAALDLGKTKSFHVPQTRTKSTSSGLLSKLKTSGLSNSFTISTPLTSKNTQDSDYGTIPGKIHAAPERGYSLFGERVKSQVCIRDNIVVLYLRVGSLLLMALNDGK
ncbi:hypothetical protein BGZ65_004097 [Modicella reniformis]|uniref:Uncharacterized protein n=1 Tax=Modicella reniformis TaxID=1440133 RepID=A0A9P6SQD3_9FUNG|nr:hypothetical protein BGZ65_004097 [Modicella reniformis]